MRAPTILLADADPDSRTVYALLLEHCGFHVLQARDGEEAHRAAAELKPDVVVTELLLPSRSGQAIVLQLKRDARTSALPVIGLTVLPPSLGLTQGLLACDAYLTKPCTPSRLLREVERMLGTPAPADSAPAIRYPRSAVHS